MDFGAGTPLALNNGQMNAPEGCATISDSIGNLLFYTDGESVWNRNHTLMPNGNGTMLGSSASTQNAIIVPKPNNPNRYYIFTVDANGGPFGLSYSEVDLTANGGNGDLVSFNNLLITPTTEKVTAVRHYNLRDFWVITHEWNSNRFHAYLIEPTGVNNTPVTTSIGSTHGGVSQNAGGYMKASPDGTKIGLVLTDTARLAEVFDFDDNTGLVSNPINIPRSTFSNFTVYGVEFSSNSRFMYVATSSNPGKLHQFDLQAGNISQIVQSGQIPVATHPGFIGALQIAINGKIYASQFSPSTHLAVINNPNIAGSGCGFASNAVALASGTACRYGLPNFIQSIFINADVNYADTCTNDITQFNLDFTGADSVHWNFGDPLSGNNTSTTDTAFHTFSAPGNYIVTLIVHKRLLTDTVIKTVYILPLPETDFGLDTTMCEGQFINLVASGANTYLWQDNSTDSTFQVDTSGTYFVVATLNGCLNSDTITITDNPIPIVNLGPDTTLCNGLPYQLNAQNNGATYLWQDGSTAQTLNAVLTNIYSVTVTQNNCSTSDQVDITFSSINIPVWNDTTLCDGFELFLNVTNPNSLYQWNDGYTGPTRFIDTTGTYSVTVTNADNCSASESIIIDLQFEPEVSLGEDTVLCSGQPITLNATNYGASYQWQDNSINAIFNPVNTGIYGVSAINQCGIAADSISIEFRQCNCLVYVPTAFSPNQDTKNELFNFRYDCNEFKVSMRIYNRIGQLMFRSDNPDISWDGSYNGKPAKDGIYVYELNYSGYNDGKLDEKTERGTFLLLR